MSTPDRGTQGAQGAFDEAGGGWILFAGIMLMLVGVLNVIYGIAAIGDSSFFIHDQKYILSNLNTWGWVTLILGRRADRSRPTRSGPATSSAAGSASAWPG